MRHDAVARTRQNRALIDLLFVGLALGWVAALLVVYFQRGLVPGDAFVYLGAGERLNAGHALYAISPGDRPIGVEPPFWTVPILSPPPIAVLWRPLAILPSELGVYLWWLLDIVAVGTAVALMMRRRPRLIATAVLMLSIPLVYEIGVGNMNGMILLGLVLTWRGSTRQSDRMTGILVGVMASFKLTPALLGWWLLTTGRWRAVRWALASGLIVLAVSLVGAGLDAHLRFLGVIRETTSAGARPLSLAGIAIFLGMTPGIANLLPTVALVGGFVATAILRKRPDHAFISAIVTMVFGSPTVSINWFIYLLACLAPIVWPMTGPSHARQATKAGGSEATAWAPVEAQPATKSGTDAARGLQG